MSRDRILRIVLWVDAGLLLLGAVAVVMPRPWMNATHQRLGLGELPQSPVVDYLARSASALYALHGAIVLLVSLDIGRYRPLIRALAVVSAGFGLVMIGIDRAAGMPAWWTLVEGPGIIALGLLVLVLAGPGRCPSTSCQAETGAAPEARS